MYDGSGIEAVKRLLEHESAGGKSKKEGLDKYKTLPSAIFDLNYNKAKDFFEKAYLEYKFFQNGCIISKTAEDIGIYPSNLHAKLRKHGINASLDSER